MRPRRTPPTPRRPDEESRAILERVLALMPEGQLLRQCIPDAPPRVVLLPDGRVSFRWDADE
jgi:hypothetical protein